MQRVFLVFFFLRDVLPFLRASQVALVVKNPSANAGDIRNVDSIPGPRRSLGGGHGNPLQYSCLENPMDRGVWQATVHRIAFRGQLWAVDWRFISSTAV